MNKKLMKEQKLPSKKDVIDTIKKDIDLGGSDLVGYRIDIEENNIYINLCHLFDVDTSDKNNPGEAISDWGKVKVYSKIYHEYFPDKIFIFVSTQDGNAFFKAFEYGGPLKPVNDGSTHDYLKDNGWFVK